MLTGVRTVKTNGTPISRPSSESGSRKGNSSARTVEVKLPGHAASLETDSRTSSEAEEKISLLELETDNCDQGLVSKMPICDQGLVSKMPIYDQGLVSKMLICAEAEPEPIPLVLKTTVLPGQGMQVLPPEPKKTGSGVVLDLRTELSVKTLEELKANRKITCGKLLEFCEQEGNPAPKSSGKDFLLHHARFIVGAEEAPKKSPGGGKKEANPEEIEDKVRQGEDCTANDLKVLCDFRSISYKKSESKGKLLELVCNSLGLEFIAPAPSPGKKTGMTCDQLKSELRALGVPHNGRATKAELTALYEKARLEN